MAAARTPGAFHLEESPPYWHIYRHISQETVRGRAVSKRHRFVAVTEHHIDGDHRIVIAINYSPERVDEQLTLAEGWSLGEFHRGRPTLEGVVLRVEISPNDALVFQVNR